MRHTPKTNGDYQLIEQGKTLSKQIIQLPFTIGNVKKKFDGTQ